MASGLAGRLCEALICHNDHVARSPDPPHDWLFVLAAGVMLAALVAGVPARIVTWATTGLFAGLVAAPIADFLLTRRAWQASPPQLSRVLPDAFAIARNGARSGSSSRPAARRAVATSVLIHVTDPILEAMGMPVALAPGSAQRVETSYTVIPTCRGASPSHRPRCVSARAGGCAS